MTIIVGFVVVGWIMCQPGVLSGERNPSRNQIVAFFGPMIGIVAWMMWLGVSL